MKIGRLTLEDESLFEKIKFLSIVSYGRDVLTRRTMEYIIHTKNRSLMKAQSPFENFLNQNITTRNEQIVEGNVHSSFMQNARNPIWYKIG